jgi:hypothetical protein
MNLIEAGRVLTKIVSYDNRTTGKANILAWHEALSDLDEQECLDAVAAHFRESDAWLLPVHIRRRVAAARRLEQGRLNAERDDELRRQIERVPTKDRSAEVAELLAKLRDRLPNPGQDVLRRPEVVEWDKDRERRESAAGYDAPNPAFEGFPAPDPQPSEVEQP